MKNNKKKILSKKYDNAIFSSVLLCWISITFGSQAIVIPDVALQSDKKNHSQATYIATTQFTKEKITHSPMINLGQFLRQEQSVVRLTNNSGDSSQTALSLRGFGDNAAANSLILIDGFPFTNPSLLAPNFNSIPLSDIERIDILQGSQGVLWGDQAVGGVVNIITKHPKKFALNSILSLGSYNRYYDNIFIANKNQKGLFFKVFGSFASTHNYRAHNQQQGNNLAAQLGIDYPQGIVSVYAQSYNDQVYFPGGLSAEQFKQDPRQATEFKNNSHYHTTLFQLFNSHALSNQWIMETRLAHRQTAGNGFVFVHFDRNDRITTINPRFLGMVGDNKVILGYAGEWSQYELLNQKIQSRASAKQNDLYLQTTIPLNKKLDFIFGARKAWQSNHIEAELNHPFTSLDQVFVSEQGLVYKPNELLSFFIRRDGNFSFPKANEETWTADNLHALQVQSGISYELGATWQTPKYFSGMSIYQLRLNNEIAFNPTQTLLQPFGAFNNLAETVRNGISLSQRYQLSSHATLSSQLNYVNAKFSSGQFKGNFIPAVPAFNGNLGINYAWTEHWVAQYNLLYTSSRFPSQDLANIGKKIAGYWLHNLAFQYLLKSFIFNLELQNLFNKQYPNYAFYNVFTNDNVYYPAAGKNYLFTLKINID